MVMMYVIGWARHHGLMGYDGTKGKCVYGTTSDTLAFLRYNQKAF